MINIAVDEFQERSRNIKCKNLSVVTGQNEIQIVLQHCTSEIENTNWEEIRSLERKQPQWLLEIYCISVKQYI